MALEPLEPALGVVTETDQRLSALVSSEKGSGVHGDLLFVVVMMELKFCKRPFILVYTLFDRIGYWKF